MILKQNHEVQSDHQHKWCRMFLLYSVVYITVGAGLFIAVSGATDGAPGIWLTVLLISILVSSWVGAGLLVYCYRLVRNSELEINETRSADLKNIAGRIKKLGYYDSVTKLPNRIHFQLVLEKCVSKARMGGNRFHIVPCRH